MRPSRRQARRPNAFFPNDARRALRRRGKISQATINLACRARHFGLVLVAAVRLSGDFHGKVTFDGNRAIRTKQYDSDGDKPHANLTTKPYTLTKRQATRGALEAIDFQSAGLMAHPDDVLFPPPPPQPGTPTPASLWARLGESARRLGEDFRDVEFPEPALDLLIGAPARAAGAALVDPARSLDALIASASPVDNFGRMGVGGMQAADAMARGRPREAIAPALGAVNDALEAALIFATPPASAPAARAAGPALARMADDIAPAARSAWDDLAARYDAAALGMGDPNRLNSFLFVPDTSIPQSRLKDAIKARVLLERGANLDDVWRETGTSFVPWGAKIYPELAPVQQVATEDLAILSSGLDELRTTGAAPLARLWADGQPGKGELYDAFPDLRTATVRVDPNLTFAPRGPLMAQYEQRGRVADINPHAALAVDAHRVPASDDIEYLAAILSHEIAGHGTQQKAGLFFEPPWHIRPRTYPRPQSMTAQDSYWRSPIEVFARTSERTAGTPQASLDAIPLHRQYDIPMAKWAIGYPTARRGPAPALGGLADDRLFFRESQYPRRDDINLILAAAQSSPGPGPWPAERLEALDDAAVSRMTQIRNAHKGAR